MSGRLFRPPLLAALAALVLLSGCYLPARFDTEIELSRNGFYSINFEGYLAWVPLYEKLHNRKIGRDEEKEEVEKILRDLGRDGNVKSVSYFDKGHFQVSYKASGDLLKDRMVSFLRRNEDMITLSYNRNTRVITMRGKYVKKQDADRLAEMALWMEGEIRLKTDAAVLGHNATRVVKGAGREQTLVWEIKSPFDPAPKAEFTLR